ncbi:ParB/RepB/Spo0J family partition protein [Ignatzschineria larvae DSM 13226]|uniref:Probable chromosome-partitioning protein ParB n=1 Tax=Ignatzschineria larvae DSM 13226 TaxID=1111732 RepID=A0ABZ3C230_9GAMM
MLLSQKSTEVATDSQANVDKSVVKELAIDKLMPGQYQPRRFFDESALEALANSIKSQGIIQPIVVRSVKGDSRFEILAGERRWRAAQLAGLERVPVIFKEMSDQEALAVALIENIQREDLNPVETAIALKRLIEEFSLTHQEVGDVIGRSRSSITNTLRLLDLAPEVQVLLSEGKLDMGHARALLPLTAKKQLLVAMQVVEQSLTVRETERLVKLQLADNVKDMKKTEKDPDLLSLERNLSEILGAMTEIKTRKKGKGEVVIRYNSLDELDGILLKIKRSM